MSKGKKIIMFAHKIGKESQKICDMTHVSNRILTDIKNTKEINFEVKSLRVKWEKYDEKEK